MKKLDTKTARAAIAPGGQAQNRIGDAKKEPGWYLVYRRHTNGRIGSWAARWVDTGQKGKGGAKNVWLKEALGIADDAAPADGDSVLSYEQAVKKAKAFCKRCVNREPTTDGKPRNPETITVADALDGYFKNKEATGRRAKGLAIYKIVAARWLVPELGTIPVAKLKLSHLTDWQAWMAKQPRRGNGQKNSAPKGEAELRARRATTNRTSNILLAALNWAIKTDDDLAAVTYPPAWRNFEPLPDAEGVRDGNLSATDRKKLLEACQADFRLMVTAALLTAARHGELRQAQVKDYRHTDDGAAYLHIPASHSKSGKARNIPLTSAGASFFDAIVAGRDADAPLLTRADGSAWPSHSQTKAMDRACASAGVTPVCYHELRHTRITQLKVAGLPADLTSIVAGHSLASMTERYTHRPVEYIAVEMEKAVGEADWGLVGRPSPAAIAPLRTKRRA